LIMFCSQIAALWTYMQSDASAITAAAPSPIPSSPSPTLPSASTEELEELREKTEQQERMIADLRSRLRESQEELSFARFQSPSSPACDDCDYHKTRADYHRHLYNKLEKKIDEMEIKWSEGEKECPSCLIRAQSKSPQISWANEITETKYFSSDEEEEEEYGTSDSDYCESEDRNESKKDEKLKIEVNTINLDDSEFSLDEPF
ncbi:hypothetical protein PFISCL1PPCAC_28863, partial [Pristionchus fissidentatus]